MFEFLQPPVRGFDGDVLLVHASAPAARLVRRVTDDPAIDQRLLEAGGLVLAHLGDAR